MTNILDKFKKFEIKVSDLKRQFGDDLHNASVTTPKTVCTSDVISAIKKYLNNDISKQDLVDWVNIIWFTELFTYKVSEENSIASVISLLETLDEEGVCFTKEDYLQMINDLKNNKECGML